MVLIAVPCDHDHRRTIEITRWLHENVGLMAVDKSLLHQQLCRSRGLAPISVWHYF